MRVSCWIPKATHTHTHTPYHATPRTCNIYCFSTATMVTRTRPLLRCPVTLHSLRTHHQEYDKSYLKYFMTFVYALTTLRSVWRIAVNEGLS